MIHVCTAEFKVFSLFGNDGCVLILWCFNFFVFFVSSLCGLCVKKCVEHKGLKARTQRSQRKVSLFAGKHHEIRPLPKNR